MKTKLLRNLGAELTWLLQDINAQVKREQLIERIEKLIYWIAGAIDNDTEDKNA